MNFWGYLVTALALSLGAPFWFDMLNKVVRLRNSIQPPAKSKDTGITREGPDIPPTTE